MRLPLFLIYASLSDEGFRGYRCFVDEESFVPDEEDVGCPNLTAVIQFLRIVVIKDLHQFFSVEKFGRIVG